MPHAGFIGFTGMPIEASDRSTPAIFGNSIDIYDIPCAVEDGATVRIYHDGCLAKLALDEAEKPRLDPEFEKVAEGAGPLQRRASALVCGHAGRDDQALPESIIGNGSRPILQTVPGH